jgi:hypothetical protein
MADTGSPPGGPTRDSGLEPRVARLESDVAHLRSDIAEIKVLLNRLAPLIDELHSFIRATLPTLATKAELADLRTELKAELGELRIEMMQRPTRRQTVFDIFAIVGLIGVILTIAARFAH